MDKILLNLGYVLMLIAFVVRDILWLRSILLIGHLSLVVYALLVNNRMVAFWNIIFFFINTIQVVRLIRERRPIELPSGLTDLYEKIFSAMSRREFLFFWNMGSIKEISENLLIRKGDYLHELSLILSGSVNVVKDGKNIAQLSRGSFIAEMSFVTGESASADIIANGRVQYISWNQEKLRSLKQLNPELLIKIQNILGKDLAVKIKAATTTDQSDH